MIIMCPWQPPCNYCDAVSSSHLNAVLMSIEQVEYNSVPSTAALHSLPKWQRPDIWQRVLQWFQYCLIFWQWNCNHNEVSSLLLIAAKSQRTSKPSSALIIDGSDFLVKTSTPGLATASNASSNVSASDIDSIIGIVFGLIAAIIVLTCSFLTLRSLQYVRMQRLLQYG